MVEAFPALVPLDTILTLMHTSFIRRTAETGKTNNVPTQQILVETSRLGSGACTHLGQYLHNNKCYQNQMRQSCTRGLPWTKSNLSFPAECCTFFLWVRFPETDSSDDFLPSSSFPTESFTGSAVIPELIYFHQLFFFWSLNWLNFNSSRGL